MTTTTAQPAETKTARSTRIEYRVERIPFTGHPEEHLAELVDRLNELGRDGWRALGVDLSDKGLYYSAEEAAPPQSVLLMREVAD